MKARVVLLVDDSAEIRELYGRALRDSGLRVGEATSISEAIEVTPRIAPDLIVLDRHLPDGDGWSVARRLKTEGDALTERPVIGFSSHRPGAEGGALDAGCDSFLEKPCAPDSLVKQVLALLERR